MSRASILKVLETARPALSAHWASCREAGLEAHTAERCGRVDAALTAYFDALGALTRPPAREAVLDEIRRLFETLDGINEKAGGGLLETDERELLVPVVIDGAAAAGLDVSSFPDGDPTAEFRNF